MRDGKSGMGGEAQHVREPVLDEKIAPAVFPTIGLMSGADVIILGKSKLPIGRGVLVESSEGASERWRYLKTEVEIFDFEKMIGV